MRKKSPKVLFCLGLALFLSIRIAGGANQVVNNCSNDTELRADLTAMQSSGGGTLTFNCGPATIVLDSAAGPLPTITTDCAVDGAGKITISGNDATYIFQINPGKSLT